eukprot:240266-Hanusia_phi.AAC.2
MEQLQTSRARRSPLRVKQPMKETAADLELERARKVRPKGFMCLEFDGREGGGEFGQNSDKEVSVVSTQGAAAAKCLVRRGKRGGERGGRGGGGGGGEGRRERGREEMTRGRLYRRGRQERR